MQAIIAKRSQDSKLFLHSKSVVTFMSIFGATDGLFEKIWPRSNSFVPCTLEPLTDKPKPLGQTLHKLSQGHMGF